jgi:hypothetical protein
MLGRENICLPSRATPKDSRIDSTHKMTFISDHCPGPLARRDFLRAGALALGGIALSDVLAARAAAGQERCDTSVILFWMWGGPSQLETYDLKPEAPSEYRGPFRPIVTNVPGIEICELFPQQARLADKCSLIRSLRHEMSSHNDGSIEVLTGKTPAKADPTSTAKSEHSSSTAIVVISISTGRWRRRTSFGDGLSTCC